ncbi:MAG TPA: hypothetical protein ENN08_06725 [Bacteroidales bacterium]|nr:hypothetical protein [Bacteroidales bacterium]
MSVIKLKKSSEQGKKPQVSDLALGEVSINTHDGIMYARKNDGQDAIVEFYAAHATIVEGSIIKKTAGGIGQSVIREVGGFVGINTVAPSFELDVVGRINASHSILSDLGEFGSSKQANGYSGIIINGDENNESISFYIRDQARVVIDQSGRMGIGTLTPDEILHLKFDETNAGILIENTRTSGLRRVRLDLKTNGNLRPGSLFRLEFRGDEYTMLQTIRDADYGSGIGREVELYQFDYRNQILSFGPDPGHTFGFFDYENLRFGLNTVAPEYTLDVNGTISGSAFRIGPNAGIDMDSGTPVGVTILKGIVIGATKVTPIADGNHRIADGDTITTVGGIITAISKP